MALKCSIITVVLFSWSLAVLAHPHAKDLGGSQVSPLSLSGIFQPVLVPTNNTNAPPQPRPPVSIRCFEPSEMHKPTDLDGCRPTLNYIHSFSNYRLVQDFQQGRFPKLPSKPPYAFHHVHSNCAVQIASGDDYTIDKFSFEQARALGIEILEYCKDHGGRGGIAPLGRGIGWRIGVREFTEHPDPPGLPNLLEAVSSRNGTSVPVRLVEA